MKILFIVIVCGLLSSCKGCGKNQKMTDLPPYQYMADTIMKITNLIITDENSPDSLMQEMTFDFVTVPNNTVAVKTFTMDYLAGGNCFLTITSEFNRTYDKFPSLLAEKASQIIQILNCEHVRLDTTNLSMVHLYGYKIEKDSTAFIKKAF